MTATAKKPAKPRKDSAGAGNMRIWDSVCETDPKHTSRINQRGGFTAICAMYQRQEATRKFGPEGEGWSYDATLTNLTIGDMMIASIELRLWWRNEMGDIRYCGPAFDSCEWMPRGRFDSDAAKKATTGALTTALSGLGFNADVFLGKFDDNKYVDQMREKFKPTPVKKPGKKPADVRTAVDDISLVAELRPMLVALDPERWTGKTDEEITKVFMARAQEQGVKFDAAFINEQTTKAQGALLSGKGKSK